jgi:glucose-1-phosphate cytidylyltransferase
MKVIILCGGMGTRLREETEYRPKPMVEIGGRPILWHIMKLYSHFGYKDFILALGYKGNVIRDYFLNYDYYNNDFTVELGQRNGIKVHGNHTESDWRVTLLETGLNSMTGYRVKLCSKYITEEDFMLTYGDAVADIDLQRLVEFHRSQNTVGTVTGVYPPSRFGDLAVSDDLVTQFKEKSKDVVKQSPINGGFFVFKRRFFELIPSDPGCDLERTPLENLAKQNQLSVYKHYDFWQCMDTYRDFLLLNNLWDNAPQWKLWHD